MKQVNGHVELSGAEAPQGQVILDTPLQRAIFLAGLVGLVVAAFLLAATS